MSASQGVQGRFDIRKLAFTEAATPASIFSEFLDYILRVSQSLRDSIFYLGKLHWFLYLLLSYHYDPGMFIFCWSSNFVGKGVLNESMAAKMASLVSYLVYYNCI